MNFKTNYWWEIKARGLDATLKQKLLPTEQLLKSDDLIDMFGGGSLVTEDSPSTLSWICYKSGVVQICRWWIDCNYSLLKEPKSNEAYRVDQAAAWMLQASIWMQSIYR
jgi:hypothetical protein